MDANIPDQKTQTQALVGDIKCNHPPNAEYFETILRLLEEFMIEHDIDKIDIGWSRSGILARGR